MVTSKGCFPVGPLLRENVSPKLRGTESKSATCRNINWPGENIYGPVAKLKNLSDVHSILLGVVENDFQLVTQNESYEIASEKILGKNQHLLGKLIFAKWPKCACVGCTQLI